MTAASQVQPARRPGVVVVGGGVTGLLTALELDRRGVPALVLERTALCCGQTGQAHGWLHRGGVFPDAGTADVEHLDHGARHWAGLAGPEQVDCWIGGLHEATRGAVTAIWDHLGLPYQREPATGAYGWRLRAPESAVVPLRVLRAALARSGVLLRRAEAVRLLPGPSVGTAGALLVRDGSRLVRLDADAFVMACGAELGRLVPGLDERGATVHRLSFMLVARSAVAATEAFAVPEQEALGLFAVPRRSGRQRFLLLSNFISYAATADVRHSRDNWLAGIRPTVRRFMPELWRATDALWGVYPAVKTEPARRIALGVPDLAVLPTPYVNVVAGLPGKLTLAPLLAVRLADAVAGHTGPGPASAVPALPDAEWGPEEWEVTPLVRRATLFGATE